MKPYIYTFAAIICAFLLFAPKAHAVSWTYSRQISPTSSVAIPSAQTNFPLLVSSTLASLKTAANGGNVQNLCTSGLGIQIPCDLVFATSTANCTSGNYLNHEVERYVSSTGEIIAFVSVPNLTTSTVTTPLQMCYDATGITTDQSHTSSTWDSNYKGVWHLPDGTTTTFGDSTSNGNTGTNTGTSPATGQIDGGVSSANNYWGPGDQDIYSFGNNATDSPFTWSGWVKPTTVVAQGVIVDKYDTTNVGEYTLGFFSNNILYGWTNDTNTLAQVGRLVTSVNSYISDGQWAYIVWTYNGGATDGSFKIYINGVQRDNANLAGANTYTSMKNTTIPLNFGKANGGLGSGLTGSMDEFRLSSGVRSADWITTEYNNQASPSTFYTVGAETPVATGGDGRGEGSILFLIKNAKMTVKNGKVTIDN